MESNAESSKRPRSQSPSSANKKLNTEDISPETRPENSNVPETVKMDEDEEAVTNLDTPTKVDKGGKRDSSQRAKGERFGWDRGKKEMQEGASGDEKDGDGTSRLPKKKCAIMIGYCGSGYSGMQIQTHGSKTIEGDVFEALVKAGAVSAENSVDHRKVDVQRAARTDAGVHAAGNCISMKMIFAPPLPPEHPTLASYVNSFLPEQIRMWGFVRAQKSFVARHACDSRIYEYVLPSYCLLPPCSTDPFAFKLFMSSPGWREVVGEAVEFADAGVSLPKAEVDGRDEVEEGGGFKRENGESEKGHTDPVEFDPRSRGEYERRRGWRVDQRTMERFRALIAQYKGTHNFHNFTVKKPFTDRSVKRYMLKLEVRDPQVVGDIEWVSVQIHGQSFMLHQIRKMVSLAMLACRTGTPPSLILETFGPKRIHIPKAPPLGLLLEAPQFGTYNKRINETTGGDNQRDPIDWSIYAEEIEKFKLKYIYDALRSEELATHTFHKWLRQMDCTSTDALCFLNTRGVIPFEAEMIANWDRTQAAKDGEEKYAFEIEMESDDEVDMELLKKGELEG